MNLDLEAPRLSHFYSKERLEFRDIQIVTLFTVAIGLNLGGTCSKCNNPAIEVNVLINNYDIITYNYKIQISEATNRSLSAKYKNMRIFIQQ